MWDVVELGARRLRERAMHYLGVMLAIVLWNGVQQETGDDSDEAGGALEDTHAPPRSRALL